MMTSLQHSYLRVQSSGRLLYGGSQMLSPSPVIRRCGCGPVAAMDCLWYLEHRGETEPLPLSDYNTQLSLLCRRYFPLVPPFGINGLVFVLGFNRLLHDRGLPWRAHWMLSEGKLWPRVQAQLERDIPVILSVGPNFPMFWQNNRLSFYIRTQNGSFRKASSCKGHFVTATGIDRDWVRISSWGREYYINRAEYEAYTKAHSLYAFSNIVYLS